MTVGSGRVKKESRTASIMMSQSVSRAPKLLVVVSIVGDFLVEGLYSYVWVPVGVNSLECLDSYLRVEVWMLYVDWIDVC